MMGADVVGYPSLRGEMSMVDEWLDGYKAAGASAGTIRVRGGHVRRFADFVELASASESDVTEFLAGLPHLKPESRKSMQASLRTFYRWALLRGYVDADPTMDMRDVSVPPTVPHPITIEALHVALAAADDETTLMLLLGAYAGLRRAEIAAVHSGDVEASVLRVTGKGGRTRRVPIHSLLAECLSRLDGWAFPSPARPGRHVTPDYVSNHLESVLPPPFTPHSLRHYFATAAYRGTHDLRAVQQLLGHSRPETTARYTLIDDDALAAAVRSVA